MFCCLKQMGFCCQLALPETHYWILGDHSHGYANNNLTGGPYYTIYNKIWCIFPYHPNKSFKKLNKKNPNDNKIQ